MFRKSSEDLRAIAFTELNLASRNERSSWLTHPCTRALLNTLNADTVDMLEGWSNGNYTLPSMEGTMQLNSQALGEFKAASRVIEYIEGINDEEMFEDDQS